ncbi:hypothetical protein Back2_17800 [Nocardioides baekrokdamisoli]|uniref:ATP-dependent Clp protease proteolytic subunit n=1 Tax=Nocardioides baekrokdamisoli TaxID=1804624 RepID=A0A3G9IYI2_9ACTN|nr:head maturation protease, ClpP-related [Nocardioides baekrokdamisoli]BBH17493.1 hypothetical protein Back2_17800 [Nocardioides baekrokdamisoli]
MTRRVNTAAPIELSAALPAAGRLAIGREAQASAVPKVSVDGTKATIRIYGSIVSYSSWWGSASVCANDVAQALDELDPAVTEIQVRLNSPGGAAFEGVAILNLLRAHPAKITAVVDGLAASAASVIAVGCDETIMSPGSALMVHNPSGGAWGEVSDLQKVINQLNSLTGNMAALYAEATGSGTADDWAAVMDAETWYTATEAVEAGLADSTQVVPDAGKTITAGGTDDESEIEVDFEDDELMSALFARFGYRYAGRDAAPAPTQIAAAALAHIPPTASADGHTKTAQKETAMALPELITNARQELGLAETADEATVVAALSEALGIQPAAPVATATAAIPEGMSLIETDVLTELRTGAEDGRAARAQQIASHRDSLITAAIAAGKISPARKDHWIKQFAADAEGAEQVLAQLEPGLIPVDERGHAGDVDSSSTPQVSADALDALGATFGLQKGALNG